ncbi:MAG: hypothetical protein ACM3X6_07925 [Patescibacteria group bacterium]
MCLDAFLAFLAGSGLRRPNYAGREIPSAAGLILLLFLPVTLALGILAGVPALRGMLSLVFGLAVLGFGLAGLVDDCLGASREKGFRGHFAALLQGRLTSGAIKALFGGTVALFVGLALPLLDARAFGAWYQILLNTIILASAANLINLLDLRPGRAGKVFYLGLIVAAALACRIERFFGPVALAAVMFVPVFRRDLKARLMLGDTGANLIGAVLGMAMVFWLTPHAKIVAAAILLGLQIISERFSFSGIIERFAALRALDRWGRGSEE